MTYRNRYSINNIDVTFFKLKIRQKRSHINNSTRTSFWWHHTSFTFIMVARWRRKVSSKYRTPKLPPQTYLSSNVDIPTALNVSELCFFKVFFEIWVLSSNIAESILSKFLKEACVEHTHTHTYIHTHTHTHIYIYIFFLPSHVFIRKNIFW